MQVPVFRASSPDPESNALLQLNEPLVLDWLVRFLRHECSVRRGVSKALLGLSGGVDSALTAVLCARAFGPENVWAYRMPYKLSSGESLEHARLVVEALGIHERTLDISAMVDGYAASQPDITPARLGNVCARARMIVLFDQSAELGALPIGTGNKTERLFGYYTWHADDAPPINPLGDLFKSQVWTLARAAGVPEVIVEKPATADLIRGQTDEGDFGISYPRADRILAHLVQGRSPEALIRLGFDPTDVERVRSKVDSTHWKRHLPTVAMLTTGSIGDYYLRPVDY